MTVTYEWAVEVYDEADEDILDVCHGETIAQALDHAKGSQNDPGTGPRRLVLIRDTGTEAEGLTDRMWAYPVENRLPLYFSYADEGSNGTRVPQQFHHQIAAFVAKHGTIF